VSLGVLIFSILVLDFSGLFVFVINVLFVIRVLIVLDLLDEVVEFGFLGGFFG
jgi:hypothetical protein